MKPAESGPPPRRIALVGPVHPWRGGIAQYTTMLFKELEPYHPVQCFSYRRQYPSFLFPGRTQLDQSAEPLVIPATRDLDSLGPSTWWGTARAIEAFHPDLVLIMWWQPFLGPALGTLARCLHRRGRNVVFLCHNVVPHEGSFLNRWLSAWALRPGSAYILHAGSEKPALEGLVKDPVVRISPHPAYPQFCREAPLGMPEARARLGLKTSKVILFFGLIRPYKGLSTLIRAFRELATDPDITLVVAGECYEKNPPYQREIEAAGLKDRVLWHERFIPNEEVAPYFRASDLVVLPYDTASQSGVVQVAYAMERPILATAVGGLPEVVFPGETGELVPPRDPPALAVAIRRFYERGGSLQYQAGLVKHRELFQWSRMRRVLEELAAGPRENP